MIGARNAKHETLYRRGLSENGVNPEDRGAVRRVPAEPVTFKKDLHSGEERSILNNTMDTAGDIIKTGGISGSLSGALEPDSDEAVKHAETYYGLVRSHEGGH